MRSEFVWERDFFYSRRYKNVCRDVILWLVEQHAYWFFSFWMLLRKGVSRVAQPKFWSPNRSPAAFLRDFFNGKVSAFL